MTANNELEMIGNAMSVTNFKVLYQHFRGENEKPQKSLGLPASGTIIEPTSSKYESHVRLGTPQA